MPRPLVLATAFTLSVSCSERASAPAPAPAPGATPIDHVVVRDPSGAVVAEAKRAGDACDVSVGAFARSVRRQGPAALADDTAGLRGALEANGWHVLVKDVYVARIWREPAALAFLTPDGVPLARIAAEPAHAAIADPAGGVVALADATGGRVVVTDPHGASLAYVTGGDPELAAVLTSAALPEELRALAACDRLLPASPVP